jgi:hypothetical protein
MKEKTFVEWIVLFSSINLFFLGVIMLFAPAYPWWFFIGLSIMLGFIAPHFVNSNGSRSSVGRRNNKYRF